MYSIVRVNVEIKDGSIVNTLFILQICKQKQHKSINWMNDNKRNVKRALSVQNCYYLLVQTLSFS